MESSPADAGATVLASNNNGAPDDRNCLINYIAAKDDTLTLRVAPVTGSGADTLRRQTLNRQVWGRKCSDYRP